MAKESKIYEVRITVPVNGNPEVVLFRSLLPLEQAAQLANSLWMSTDNVFLSVSVCEENETVPCIVYHQRGL